MSKSDYNIENNVVFCLGDNDEKAYICHIDDIDVVISRLRNTIQRVNNLLLRSVPLEGMEDKTMGDVLVLMTRELNQLNKIKLLHK